MPNLYKDAYKLVQQMEILEEQAKNVQKQTATQLNAMQRRLDMLNTQIQEQEQHDQIANQAPEQHLDQPEPVTVQEETHVLEHPTPDTDSNSTTLPVE